MENKDYYKILDVTKTAKANEIKESYRKLALKYHPDRNQDSPEAVSKMKLINEAYAVLSDNRKRDEYDTMQQQFGTNSYSQFRQSYTDQDIFNGSDINQILEEMAKSFGLRGFEDIFSEHYGNRFHRFEFKRPGFYARGGVFFGAPGRQRGCRRSVSHRRQARLPGSFGKLSRYVFNKLSGMELPENGSDIRDVISISAQKAQQGGSHAYYLKQKAKKLIIQIPPGVHKEQQIRLAGMGTDGKGGGRCGDLYLKVKIKKAMLEKINKFIARLKN
ncbi:MAG: J domain-containing protein [Desulfosarcina sp.]|nr:J domain-containing protein [Desulfobacterales bacterium]